MTWESELARRDSKPVVCLEIILNSQTIYTANTDLQESDKFWRARLAGISPIVRNTDPTQQQMSVQDLNVSFHNYIPDGESLSYWALVQQADVMRNAVANVYLKFVADDGEIFSRKMYSGLLQPKKGPGEKTFNITIKAAYRTKLKLLQRQVNTVNFSNSPDDSQGHAMPIPLGICNATTGAIEAPEIDSGADWFLVSGTRVFAIGDTFRYRGQVLTAFPASSEVPSAEDGEGHGHAYIDVTPGHQAGDEYYANVSGLGRDGYVTLDGANDWLELDAADTEGMVGHDYRGTFTVEVKYRATTVPRAGGVIGVFDSDDHSWLLLQNNAFNVVNMSLGTDVGNATYVPDTNIIAGTDYIERWVVDFEQGIVRGQRDGVDLTFTGSANLPAGATELNQSSFPFKIGSYTTVSGATDVPFLGRIYYGIVAKGAQPLTTGTGDHNEALTDIISEWRLKETGGRDIAGSNHLTEVSLADGDYTLESVEENPARFLQEILSAFDGWGFPSNEIHRQSFNDAADNANERWPSISGYFGGVIPRIHGMIQSANNQWVLAQAIARSFDHTLMITRDGLLALVLLDTITTVDVDATPIIIYDQKNGDMKGEILGTDQDPFPHVNEIRAVFKNKQSFIHAAATEAYLLARNETAQIDNGVIRDKEQEYQFVCNANALQGAGTGVLDNQLLLRSGNTKYVTWTTPGLWGLQANSDIGDAVSLSANGIFGEWNQKQVRVFSVAADLWNGTVTLTAATIGDQVGSIAFSGEATVILTPVHDTYVRALDTGGIYGAAQTLAHSNGFTSKDEPPHITPGHQRTALRYDVSGIPDTAIIKAASLGVYCEFAFNDRIGGIPDLSLRQLLSTGWDEDISTWANFDGSIWTDANCGGTPFTASVAMGIGARTFVLNAAGIAYIQGRVEVAGDDLVQLGFQPASQMEPFDLEAYIIGSKENSNSAKHPLLTITYEF